MSAPNKPGGKHPRAADRPRLFDDDDDIETRVAERPEDEQQNPTLPEARRGGSAAKRPPSSRATSNPATSNRTLPSLSDVSGPVTGLRDDGPRMRHAETREDEPDPRNYTVPQGLKFSNVIEPTPALTGGNEVATKINPASLLGGAQRTPGGGDRPMSNAPVAVQTASGARAAQQARMTRELPPGSILDEEELPTSTPDGPQAPRAHIPSRTNTPSPDLDDGGAPPVVLPPATRSRLGVAAGPDAGRELPLEELDLSVGRAADNHLILVDPLVSRHHVALRWDGARYHIRDLASASGTQVNGVALVGERRLFDGDTIDLGSTVIRLDLISASRVPARANTNEGAARRVAAASSPLVPSPPRAASNPRASGQHAVARPPSDVRRDSRDAPPPSPVRAAPKTVIQEPGPPNTGLPILAEPPETFEQPQDPSIPPRGFEPQATMINSPLHQPPAPADADRPKVEAWDPKTSELAALAGLALSPSGTPRPMTSPQLPASVRDALASLDSAPPAPGLESLGISVKAPPEKPRWPIVAVIGILLLGGGLGIAFALRNAKDDDAKIDLPEKGESRASMTGSMTQPGGGGPTPSVTPKPLTSEIKPDAASAPAPTPTLTPPDATTKKPALETASKTVKKRPPDDEDPDDEEDAPPVRKKDKPEKDREPSSKSGGNSTAEKTALGQYRGADFEAAAATLRDAGMAEVARDYELVGRALKLNPQSAAEGPAAMAAVEEAIVADAKSGKRAHAAELKALLGKIAPKAAMAHYVAGRFEKAKTACDLSDKNGIANDPQVARVRNLLEAKAKELYAGAEKGDASTARLVYNRILRMVPPSSEWYEKAKDKL